MNTTWVVINAETIVVHVVWLKGLWKIVKEWNIPNPMNHDDVGPKVLWYPQCRPRIVSRDGICYQFPVWDLIFYCNAKLRMIQNWLRLVEKLLYWINRTGKIPLIFIGVLWYSIAWFASDTKATDITIDSWLLN